MEFLLADVFGTAFVALLLSFLVAKLVSISLAAGSSSGSDSKSESAADDANNVVEELQFGQEKDGRTLQSEKRVRSVEQTVETVDRFQGELVAVEDMMESSVHSGAFGKKRQRLAEERVDVDETVNDEAAARESEAIRVLETESKSRSEELYMEQDEDWEGIERSELEKAFAEAARLVEESGKEVDLADMQVELYGLYKIATEGPCREPPPMALKVSARAKWNSWQHLGNMSPEAAMEQYIAVVSDRVPGLMEKSSAGKYKPKSETALATCPLAPDSV